MSDSRLPGFFDVLAPLSARSGRGALCRADWQTEAAERRRAEQAKIERMFNMCLVPAKKAEADDYEAAAKELGIEAAVIRAIAKIEGENAKSYEGRPVILFERHVFHRKTAGKHSADHPGISNKQSGGYGRYRQQYDRLAEAFSLDASAALESASWGTFQIMGGNYDQAGFSSVEEMVLAMADSEKAQLAAFTAFVRADPRLKKAMASKDWAAIAKAYNGPDYAKNEYDTRLQEAYKAFAKPAPAAGGKSAPKSPSSSIPLPPKG